MLNYFFFNFYKKPSKSVTKTMSVILKSANHRENYVDLIFSEHFLRARVYFLKPKMEINFDFLIVYKLYHRKSINSKRLVWLVIKCLLPGVRFCRLPEPACYYHSGNAFYLIALVCNSLYYFDEPNNNHDTMEYYLLGVR